MPISIYETRTMLDAIEQFMPNYNFLRDTFFTDTFNAQTEHVDIDYRKGKRKLAPFVAPLQGGKVMERQGYETRTIKFPQIAPERPMTLTDLKTRLPGEPVYGGMSDEERAARLLARDLTEITEYVDRREEWMAAQLLFTGAIDITCDGYAQRVNFNFTNKETLSGTNLWSNAASKPLDNLETWRKTIIQKTGVAPDICVMASDVANAYQANAQVQALHDKLHMLLGNYEPRVKNPAVTFLEKLNKPALELYTYDDWYVGDAGTEMPFVPAGHVLVVASGLRHRRMYGPVTQLEGQDYKTYFASRVPKMIVDERSDARLLRLTARPILVPYDVDGWYVAKVL